MSSSRGDDSRSVDKKKTNDTTMKPYTRQNETVRHPGYVLGMTCGRGTTVLSWSHSSPVNTYNQRIILTKDRVLHEAGTSPARTYIRQYPEQKTNASTQTKNTK